LSYEFSIFFFLGGLVGAFVLESAFSFILSISYFDAFSATHKIVAFGTVSGSLLKFASIIYALSADPTNSRLCCDVSSRDCRALFPKNERALAGKIPSTGI